MFKSSSVFNCGDIDKEKGMALVFGKIEFENINNTFNKAKLLSGLHIFSFRPGSFVKFSNFRNLTENSPDNQYSTLMESENEDDTAFITLSNFVSNNVNIDILIVSHYKMTVENCSIFDNTCKYTFGANEGTITVRHCYFDKVTTTASLLSADVVFESNISSKFTNLFNETVYICPFSGEQNINERVRQRDETVLVNNKFIDALCMTVPIILQLQS